MERPGCLPSVLTFFLIILLLTLSPKSFCGTLEVISLSLTISTSSDWTRLTFHNLTLLNWEYHLITGENAPNLTYPVSTNTIAISKEQYDETNVTIRINVLAEREGSEVRLIVEKGAIGNTILRISYEDRELVTIRSIGSVPGNEDTNTRSFELSDIFESSEVNLIQIDLTRVLEEPIVLAFYYPWYGNPMGASGKQFHWEDIGYSEIGSSTFYPLLGPYDSFDERLIEAHVKLAKAAGCDGFISSWWGIDTFEDMAFRRILDISNREFFNVTIYYESVREMSQDQIVDELTYVLSNYSNEPSFLKVDGMPVVFLYAVSAYGRDPTFWDRVARSVENLTDMDVLFIADTFDLSYATFDGFHTYNPIWIRQEAFNSTYYAEAKGVRLSGKIWAATVAPGYDDRKIRSPGMYVDRENGAYYNLTWGSAISSDPDLVLICSWNEWHEGTTVEPSRESGFDDLLLTRDWSEEYKNIDLDTPLGFGPKLNQSIVVDDEAFSFQLRNEGDEDAFAVNVLLNLENASEYSVIGPINLPVNSTCISVFVPLIQANETYSMGISFQGLGSVTISASTSYYSLCGRKYLSSITEEMGPAGDEEIQSPDPVIGLVLGSMALVAILLGLHARRRVSKHRRLGGHVLHCAIMIFRERSRTIPGVLQRA